MSPTDTASGSSEEGRLKALISDKGKLVSDCLLERSSFTILGVVIGTILGVRRRHLRPLVSFSLLGTGADLIYGYGIVCDPLIRDLKASRAALERLKTREESQ